MNELKGRWNERKQCSFIPIIFCIALAVTGLWFPAWHMHIVIAYAFCLAALVAIPLMVTVLFVLVWALTRFIVKEEN